MQNLMWTKSRIPDIKIDPFKFPSFEEKYSWEIYKEHMVSLQLF